MTLLIHELERTETRVLGALRCIDASTGAALAGPLQVSARQPAFAATAAGSTSSTAHGLRRTSRRVRSASGCAGAGLGRADSDAAGSGRRLPAAHRYAGPAARPAAGERRKAGSLFSPVDAMFPAASRRWAPTGRCCAWRAGNRQRRRAGRRAAARYQRRRTLGRGMTDWRGEALVAVPGVPVTTWSDEPRRRRDRDRRATRGVLRSRLRHAHASPRCAPDARRSRPAPEPREPEAQRAALPRRHRLTRGRPLALSFPLALP